MSTLRSISSSAPSTSSATTSWPTEDSNSTCSSDHQQTQLSPSDTESIAHFVTYGRPGAQQKVRALSTSWGKPQPFRQPIGMHWSVPISSPVDIVKLLMGFVPQAMEDKWFVYADDPGQDGTMNVHFIRSWTDLKMAELKIRVESDPIFGLAKGSVENIRWETDAFVVGEDGLSESEVKATVREVCAWVLGVELGKEDGK